MKIAAAEPPELVADALAVARASVYRWIEPYNRRRHADDLLERSRSGRPSKLQAISEDTLEQLLEQSPEVFGYRSTSWTVALLRSDIEG